jgi:hypothetical protein
VVSHGRRGFPSTNEDARCTSDRALSWAGSDNNEGVFALQICATATEGTTSEWQEAHLPLPFVIEAALGQENQIVDSLSDRRNGSYPEHPWHRLTCCNAIECVLRQGRDIVRDDDAPLVGGPLQN